MPGRTEQTETPSSSCRKKVNETDTNVRQERGRLGTKIKIKTFDKEEELPQ